MELSAILARFSGLLTGDNMVGYSIQQSVYMGTRFLMVLLLPVLGFAVDRGMTAQEFQFLAHFSLFLSFALGVGIFFLRWRMIEYYIGVIGKYKETGKFVRAFAANKKYRKNLKEGNGLVVTSEGRSLLLLSTLVFSIYGVGIFSAFYCALIYSDYRAAISQLSGVVNAGAALILTFFVEPVISRRIDEKNVNASSLVMCLFFGRILAVAFFGQIMLLTLFGARQ
ncbi:lipid II flippase family protein [Variovorax paradoxus]|uniref:lipid II flippase family protein n=1 Tax=Variovorax paradoxus TaxID=34073 RepID=UPI003ECE8F0C